MGHKPIEVQAVTFDAVRFQEVIELLVWHPAGRGRLDLLVELRDLLPEQLEVEVLSLSARETWSEVGNALGVTRQSAWARYHPSRGGR